jgi:phosphatidylglycerophosphate synthase
MKNVLNEFKRCLKPIYIEEVFDLFVFRPFAYLLVKAIYRLPITPNQVTLAGLVAALIGGIFMITGTRNGFLIGGLFYLLAVVFDCADGMLARLKKNGTKTGRILDGVFDYIATTFIMVGLGVGLLRAGVVLPANTVLIMIVASLSAIFQSMTVDYAKSQFLAHGLEKARPITDEVAEFEEELARLQQEGGHYFDSALIHTYLFYSKLQARSKKPDKPVYERHDYFRKNVLPIRLWTLIGPGSHRAFFILAAILFQPMIYFVFAIAIGNVWMLMLLGWQSLIKRSLKRRPKQKLSPRTARRVGAASQIGSK